VILLTDIILESASSEEAVRLGLEKKPGFGLYGPPGGPATHRSWLGKLRPLGDKKSSSAADNLIDKVSGFFGKSSKSDSTHPPFTHPSAKSADIAASLRETFTKSGAIKDVAQTLSALTRVYGRDKAPPVVPPASVGSGRVSMSATAVYNDIDDTIHMADEYINLTNKRMAKWNRHDLYSFRAHIHEALHSTSPRLRGRGTHESAHSFYNTAINIAIEEGLTEYLSYSITTDLLQNPELSNHAGYTYIDYVDAIKMMADHGNLDVDATFRDGSKDEEGEWNIRTTIYNAQYYAIRNTMINAGHSQEDVYEIFDIVRTQWSMDYLSLSNWKFDANLQEMAKGNKISLDDLKSSLENAS
jgi:hypothetical protein